MNIYDHIIEPIIFDRDKINAYEKKLSHFQDEINTLLVRVDESYIESKKLDSYYSKRIEEYPMNSMHLRIELGTKTGTITRRRNRLLKRIKEIRTRRHNEQRRLHKKSNNTN
jgi:hypothetical protein|tara:strand:- start:242 stop:577 length:336 start_codon:yes stop_codon:yes gene_type:complete